MPVCKQCQHQFTIYPEDKAFYQKISVLEPTLCPDCRQQRRLLFRNLRVLYQRKCDLSGANIISPFAPNSKHTVYRAVDWWSDKWDPLKYGRDYNFSKTFFEQFKELFIDVPVIHHLVINSENCNYVNGAAYCKNCYLSFNMDYCEDSYYITNSKYGINCLDCLSISKCEQCYECIDCIDCYHLLFSERCSNCYDSYFLSDCKNCRNCIACSNLVGGEYCVFNKTIDKLKFEELKKDLQDKDKLNKFKQEATDFNKRNPKKYYFGSYNEEFSGFNIKNLKNSHWCFDSSDLENCNYCNYVFNAKDCMDYTIFGDKAELIYNCLATGINSYNNICCMACWNGSKNCQYCTYVSACSDCFGCSGLKHKQYCILNKQYTKDEYELLKDKIINQMKDRGEYGEFFPADLSFFAYNETVANEYFPLSKEEVLKRGWAWKDEERKKIDPALLICLQCEKNYKMIDEEKDFYLKLNLPEPELCHNCRNDNRINKKIKPTLFKRQCAQCKKEIITAYAPNRPEIIYCEECYNKEIY